MLCIHSALGEHCLCSGWQAVSATVAAFTQSFFMPDAHFAALTHSE